MALRLTSKNKIDMLHGRLWDKVLLFALPIAFSSILQQLFNAADIAVGGRFAGTAAMAAVGSNSALISLIIGLFVGLSVGANVVIASALGKGDARRANEAVHTAMSVALLSGLFLLIFGQLAIRPLLHLMDVPEDILELSVLYLRIYFISMPFMMLYNFGAAVLRSKGDTQRPMIVLACVGVVNVGLNLLLVCVFGMSVDGVAIATVVSQALSGITLVWLLMKEEGELKLRLRMLRIDKTILKEIAIIGIPSGLQGCVFSLSNVCIQSAINSLGTVTMAACTAVLNYEMFAVYILTSFSQACVTFTSQNYGAGNYRRCTRVLITCLGLGTIFMYIISLSLLLWGRPLIGIFDSDPAVVEIGMIRVRYIMPFQLLNLTIDVVSGSLRGLGRSFLPTGISLMGICGVRLLWVYTVFRLYPSLPCLVIAYPLSWTVTTIGILIAYMIVRKSVFPADTAQQEQT